MVKVKCWILIESDMPKGHIVTAACGHGRRWDYLWCEAPSDVASQQWRQCLQQSSEPEPGSCIPGTAQYISTW